MSSAASTGIPRKTITQIMRVGRRHALLHRARGLVPGGAATGPAMGQANAVGTPAEHLIPPVDAAGPRVRDPAVAATAGDPHRRMTESGSPRLGRLVPCPALNSEPKSVRPWFESQRVHQVLEARIAETSRLIRAGLEEVMPDLKVGDAAPDFTLQDSNGQTVRLTNLRGKKVVLYFFTSPGGGN